MSELQYRHQEILGDCAVEALMRLFPPLQRLDIAAAIVRKGPNAQAVHEELAQMQVTRLAQLERLSRQVRHKDIAA